MAKNRQNEASPPEPKSFGESLAEAVATNPANLAAREHRVQRGIYFVMLPPCPRRIIETNLPAGEAAEAVARERYMQTYGLIQRPGKIPSVELVE